MVYFLIMGIIVVLLGAYITRKDKKVDNFTEKENKLKLVNMSGINLHVLKNGEEIAVLKPHVDTQVGKLTTKLSPGNKITATDDDGHEVFRSYTIDQKDNTIIFGGAHGTTEYSKVLVGITHDIDLIEVRNFGTYDYEIKYIGKTLGIAKSGEMTRFRNFGYGFHLNRDIELVDTKTKSSIFVRIDNKNLTHIDVGIIYGLK